VAAMPAPRCRRYRPTGRRWAAEDRNPLNSGYQAAITRSGRAAEQPTPSSSRRWKSGWRKVAIGKEAYVLIRFSSLWEQIARGSDLAWSVNLLV
jgi:hypothetical protein